VSAETPARSTTANEKPEETRGGRLGRGRGEQERERFREGGGRLLQTDGDVTPALPGRILRGVGEGGPVWPRHDHRSSVSEGEEYPAAVSEEDTLDFAGADELQCLLVSGAFGHACLFVASAAGARQQCQKRCDDGGDSRHSSFDPAPRVIVPGGTGTEREGLRRAGYGEGVMRRR